MSRLPVLLSIPHGGTATPPELADRLCIAENDLFDDGDPFTCQIYDLGGRAEKVIAADIARAFVDPNRSLQEMPPESRDGVIKSMTCYKKPIYAEGREPGEVLRKALVERYYMPYHRKIQKALAQSDLQLCLDCHSMAAAAPPVSPDGGGEARPAFCISNLRGATSSREMMDLLADCISESFSIGRDEISRNRPFEGGHIIRTYGSRAPPWIQVEISRDLYLSERWFDRGSMSFKDSRLRHLNSMFGKALESFFGRI